MISIIGLDEPAIDELCRRVAPEGRLWKANLLGPGNIVVSGENKALEAVEAVATELGAGRVVSLKVAGAFHSPIMRSGAESLDEFLSGITFPPPRIPVYSNVDASPHDDPAAIRGKLIAQVIGEVRWEQSMRRMLADGFDTFYEVGPGRVLTGLLKRIDRKIPCTSVPAR
jgi:[acyl-carrier-protein] S-malonyltransferase